MPVRTTARPVEFAPLEIKGREPGVAIHRDVTSARIAAAVGARSAAETAEKRIKTRNQMLTLL